MKTVTIPNDYHPYEVEVNGKEYRFPAGATVSVPDEVAAVIENYYKLQPKEKPTDGGALPYVSKENDGDVLTVKDGAWTTGEGGGSGDAGWKTFVWDMNDNRIDFVDSATREHYLTTPEPFYAVCGDDMRLAVITYGGALLTYTLENSAYTLNVFVLGEPDDSKIEVRNSTVSDWSLGSERTLPLTGGTSYGDVLMISADGYPQWKPGASFPKVTITQEELGSKIMNIGAFTAQANDTVQMKTFSFTGTAGSSIAGKILGILESGAGFIGIEGFGVQALAYKMSQMAVSTAQTYGYLSDPTKPFLFSADYVINDIDEQLSVDLNFYVQKVNVVS